jgi:hypothetical protein
MRENEEIYFAFSEQEFSILAGTCGVKSLLCYDPENGRSEICKVDKRTYINTVYKLIKRNIIKEDKDKLVLQPEIKELFLPLRNSDYIIWYSCGYSERTEGFIYLKYDKEFISALPGKRNGEYIRLCRYEKRSLFTFLKDCLLNDWKELREKIELIVFDGTTHNELTKICWNNEKPDKLMFHKGGSFKMLKNCWNSINSELKKTIIDKGGCDDTC